MNEPLKIIPSKTDADSAAEIKAKFIASSQPVVALLEDAKAQGFEISFQIGIGPLGRMAVIALKVSKEF